MSHQIPHDDLLDVSEITMKIEKYIAKSLFGHSQDISMSALMSATINSLTKQCCTIEELVFHRNLFIQILDDTIRQIKIWKKK